MSEIDIRQRGNTVHGDLAAGDIDKSIVNNFSFNRNIRIGKIKELFALFQHEKDNNIQFTEVIEELEHFSTPKIENVVGVEEKLRVANRQHFTEYALEVKELYSKKLLRHQLYESAQKINVFLLALVRNYYMAQVYPLIISGADEITIGNALQLHLIDPLLQQLDGDTLGFTADDISGMLYFLTGNCHIKWAS